MKIKKASWHYKLFQFLRPSNPTDTCDYFMTLFWGVLMLAFFTLAGGMFCGIFIVEFFEPTNIGLVDAPKFLKMVIYGTPVFVTFVLTLFKVIQFWINNKQRWCQPIDLE